MGLSRRRTLKLAAAAAFAPFGQAALADAYPSRVVRLFVGFPPGGGADLATRIVANALSELWHQQVVVENRPEPEPGLRSTPWRTRRPTATPCCSRLDRRWFSRCCFPR